MRTQKAYCSACDRQVEVVVPEELPEGALPSAHDPASCICLEFGESCTGDMCPLFEVPTEQMKQNLERMLDPSNPRPEEGQDG